MTKVTSVNRRTLDLLAARCYFYHSRAYEVNKRLDEIRGQVLYPLTYAEIVKQLSFEEDVLHQVSDISIDNSDADPN
ncbi:putative 26S proteasome non-ATPase regulatory subunit 3 [Portunus trituberculatus]|uniref:Putative 26S proteasome non-ATPase regulatory subunit 3 n=1 Tax=Portunus trituberculatus TaxID=210409 RepID=A0A5B7JWU3_PORTR|nr:putative 26S proteasome non-ATPase regulatory subunit 3 [Portunus trituberculatus]